MFQKVKILFKIPSFKLFLNPSDSTLINFYLFSRLFGYTPLKSGNHGGITKGVDGKYGNT